MNDASSGEPLSSGGDQSGQAEDDQQASTGHGHERSQCAPASWDGPFVRADP